MFLAHILLIKTYLFFFIEVYLTQCYNLHRVIRYYIRRTYAMLTVLKPFLKYNFILTLLLILYYLLVTFTPDKLGINYVILVYCPILLLSAPIIFGIWYGRYICQNNIFSFKSRLKIIFIIFILSYITYFTPYWKWLIERSIKLSNLTSVTLFPSSLLTMALLCSLTFNNKRSRS